MGRRSRYDDDDDDSTRSPEGSLPDERLVVLHNGFRAERVRSRRGGLSRRESGTNPLDRHGATHGFLRHGFVDILPSPKEHAVMGTTRRIVPDKRRGKNKTRDAVWLGNECEP